MRIRRRVVIHCTKCKAVGHNIKRCPQKQSQENAQNFDQIPLEAPSQKRKLNQEARHRKKQRTRSTVRGAQETNQADAVEHINESVAAHVIESDAAGGTEAEANEIGTEDLIQSVDDLLNEIRRSRATTIPNDEQAHPDLPEESRSRRNPTNLQGQGKKSDKTKQNNNII